ncbi:hypothetical protein V6Z11_D11G064200 [Gossypium hirsutum]
MKKLEQKPFSPQISNTNSTNRMPQIRHSTFHSRKMNYTC